MKNNEMYLYQLTERIERYSQAEESLTINRLYKILFLKKYLHNTRPAFEDEKNDNSTSNIYTDTLSLFAELIFRISEEPDLKEQFLNCFKEINNRHPLKNADFIDNPDNSKTL